MKATLRVKDYRMFVVSQANSERDKCLDDLLREGRVIKKLNLKDIRNNETLIKTYTGFPSIKRFSNILELLEKVGLKERWHDEPTTPCFKNHPLYKHTALIIDVIEIFSQTPSRESREALQRMLFSYYKNHHTAKVLVFTAPTDHVIYDTPPYGSRISENDLTAEYAWIFEKLWPGARVMADKGFTNGANLGLEGQVDLPAFLKKDEQFSQEEKLVTKEVASRRIHVERVIQKAKIFKIMTDEVPIEMLNYYDMVVQ
eukprot:Pgem_evm1s17111